MTVHPDVAEAARRLVVLAGEPPEDVAGELYGWYLRLNRLPVLPGPLSPVEVDLAAALDAAHADARRYTGGWVTTAVGVAGTAAAERGGLTRELRRAEYVVPSRPGLPARMGDRLLVRAAWTFVDDEHGFWYTRRGAWPPAGAGHLTRTYVAVAPADAPAVVGTLTSLLARHPAVPYQLKVHLPVDRVARADSLVLYLGTPDAEALDEPLRGTLAGLAGVLRPVRPRFTAELVAGLAGVGRADGALDGESFGAARCAVLAAAWEGLEPAARADEAAVTRALVAALVQAGVDPDRPERLARVSVEGAVS